MAARKTVTKNKKVAIKKTTVTKKTVVKKVVKAKLSVRKVSSKEAIEAVKAMAETSAPTSLKLRGASGMAVSPKKEASLNASVYDLEGKIAGHIGLPEEIFNVKINNSLMSQAVRVYLANQRLGTAKIKHRGEVDRTTKKIYQQKGTGRARHGSRRAPIFVGGGKVFGPIPRDFSLNISKKMKTSALFSALSSKLKDGEIKIIKGLETIAPKTKLMIQVLKKNGIKEDSKVLLVMPKSGKETENIYRAGKNIEGMEILNANTINTYKVLDNALIILMKDSIDILKNTFIQHLSKTSNSSILSAKQKGAGFIKKK
jgi:large subunit ribosomal protein L4